MVEEREDVTCEDNAVVGVDGGVSLEVKDFGVEAFVCLEGCEKSLELES